jgi:predicted dinucleotide-binding enzyme
MMDGDLQVPNAHDCGCGNDNDAMCSVMVGVNKCHGIVAMLMGGLAPPCPLTDQRPL